MQMAKLHMKNDNFSNKNSTTQKNFQNSSKSFVFFYYLNDMF